MCKCVIKIYKQKDTYHKYINKYILPYPLCMQIIEDSLRKHGARMGNTKKKAYLLATSLIGVYCIILYANSYSERHNYKYEFIIL